MYHATIVLSVGAALAGFVACLAFDAYPPSVGDATFFLPPAVEYARRGVLYNPVATIAPGMVPGPFDYHGPLTPIVVGSLMRNPGIGSALAVCGLLNAVVLLLFALLRAIARGHSRPSTWSTLIDVLSLFALATCTFDLTGRPETVARLIVLLAVTVAVHTSARWQPSMLGTLLGLMVLAHPVGAVLAALLLLSWFAARGRGRVLVRALLEAGLATCVSLVLAFVAFVPLGPGEWLRGLTRHAASITARTDTITWDGLLHYWVWSPNATGYLFVLMAAVSVGFLHTQVAQRRTRAQPGLAVAGLIAFVWVGWLAAFRLPATAYNLQLFAPVAVFVICEHVRQRHRLLPAVAREHWLFACILLAAATGFARTSLLFVPYARHGTSLSAAQRQLRERRATGQYGTLALSSNAFPLVETGDRANRFYFSIADALGHERVLVTRQSGSGSLVPEILPGYRVAYDAYCRTRPVVLGVSLGHTVPGYGFAIYERLSPPD